MDYVFVKWVHILSSTVLFGTGVGSAYYMLVTSLGRDVRATAVVARHVVRADWWFTTPTVVLQPLSGAMLVSMAGYPWGSFWIVASGALYLFALACWLPVVWIQMRMRDLAAHAVRHGTALAPRYWQLMGWWTLLGVLAFVAFLMIFYLMVAKPA